MKRTIYSIIDFFLPQYCTGCNKKLPIGESPLCDDCFRQILSADTKQLDLEYRRKFKNAGYVQEIFSPYVFENEGVLQNIIHSLKYKKRFRIGVLLGKKLAEEIQGRIVSWDVDLIIPVPLFHLKRIERGFNQSDYIVKGLADSLNIPTSNKIIKRTRFTESQTKLNVKERKENVAGAFKVKRKKKVADKNILIVDDVITTGATVNECAKLLLENSAAKVYACSVAIAE